MNVFEIEYMFNKTAFCRVVQRPASLFHQNLGCWLVGPRGVAGSCGFRVGWAFLADPS